MALYALGPALFDIKAGLEGFTHKTDSAFAKHDVYGAAPVYENTGEGETQATLSGKVLPYLFGGLNALAVLEASRLAKVPLPLMRGDYTPMGWFLITGISQTHDALEPHEGIGMEISWTVDLVKSGPPGSAADVLRLFLT